MLIGISGKIGSGKDTVGKIIQYLTSESSNKMSSKYRPFSVFLLKGGGNQPRNFDHHYYSNVEIKKFADNLKDTVCLWTGCTREQLEDHTFKDSEIGEEWVRYGYADGHNEHYRNGEWTKSMNVIWCDKETYEEQKRINWQTAYKQPLTYRMLMQLLGTECMRNTIHINGWVNSLFANYRPIDDTQRASLGDVIDYSACEFPNWVITDVRFPNELEAIKKRKGISIRVNRYNSEDGSEYGWGNPNTNHPSETALDNAEFDYTINNNSSMEDLVNKVREILIKEKIINE